jgi:hypothetical protein
MLTFKLFVESCWKGYTAIGVKKKGGRTVPNCVPVKEDGMGGAVSAGPTNAVSSGAIAGSGGKGGEPGVSKKRNPVMMGIERRKAPQ